MKATCVWGFGAGAALIAALAVCGVGWFHLRQLEERQDRALLIDVIRAPGKGSPFSTPLRDASGQEYTVQLAADDEQSTRNGEVWSGAELGDPMVSGTYRFSLTAVGGNQPQRQPVWPFEDGFDGEFNLERNYVYLVRSRWTGQPDLLVIEQYGGSNGNYGRLYLVRSGVLRPVMFVAPAKKPTTTQFWSPHGFTPAGYLSFHSHDYDNSTGISSERTWRLDPQNCRLLEVAVQH